MEMTLKEIEERLGHKIAIVSEKRKPIHRVVCDFGSLRQIGRTTMMSNMFLTLAEGFNYSSHTNVPIYVTPNRYTSYNIFGENYMHTGAARYFILSDVSRGTICCITNKKLIFFLDCVDNLYTPEQIFQMFPYNDIDIYIARL